ncbi:MAG TPA: LacI family DNA-binding transcriptional regulator [Blastocatellia bacterium]|jgi:LacI family transcriptional regulator|nr:LacI family DNA-binding transcriptional regulator [Blastocatellia bacterium]
MKIKDVARLAGVSTATVSHVINNTRFVSEETRHKVQAAINAYGYTPNAHARSLASGRSRILGLIISDIANPFFPELVKSIEEKASARGYEIILSNTNYDPKRTVACVQRMLDQRASGVAILTSEMDLSLSRRLADKEVAVVFLDVGEVGPHMSNIVVNYEKGIREGVEHLLALGHRRIAYISGPSRLKSAARRKTAFARIMKKYQASLGATPLIFEGDFKTTGGQRAADEILRLKPMPTAIVSGNDLMAIGALRELKGAGLRVPQDISVIGFDDISFAALTDPPLTTILIPRSDIGENAVEALIHTIRAADNLGREFKVGARLVVRESTGAARPEGGNKKR